MKLTKAQKAEILRRYRDIEMGLGFESCPCKSGKKTSPCVRCGASNCNDCLMPTKKGPLCPVCYRQAVQTGGRLDL